MDGSNKREALVPVFRQSFQCKIRAPFYRDAVTQLKLSKTTLIFFTKSKASYTFDGSILHFM